MNIFLNILGIFLLCTVWFGILFFFSDESCLPYKRKTEKMLDTIKSYQNKIDAPNVEFPYKGKTFKVGVAWHGDNYYYGYYTVHINGNHVMTWHVLTHLFSKSRQEEHHGDMLASEEYEIIKAAYKVADKGNTAYWLNKYAKASYFN